ncbi:thrombospondin type-1 domain-containing protein 7A-like [Ptychodera flava]|uniref:thrombospondin type-1 domain-containing protein 7A-like n=1 Tax=Ptychodera flava TaxID=63121 RepID=UPI00396A5ED2
MPTCQIKPETSRTCELPCPGDCVMSSWSEFSDCSEPCPIGGIKTRSREIIRLPSADGKQCGEEVDFVQCNREPCVPLIYTTELGEWTDCKPTSGDCGQGYKQRPVNCVRSDGVVVSPSNCKDFDVTLSIATCDVQCSEDCILSDYSDWSMCSHMCGMDGHKSRSRTVDNPSRQYGRPCQHELTQRTPCNVKPCYSYEWYRSEWSRCSIDSKGCGFGEKTRTVECRRSDGHTVDDVLCILQGEHYGNLTELQKITSSLNKTDLDLETTIPCGSVCPGDCQVSEWSDYSPCFITCDSDENGWKVRSRYITQRQSEGGKPCPESLLEVKKLSGKE